MPGWKIRKNDWYVIDPRRVEDGGKGILRRETALNRAEAWMAGLHKLPLAEKRRVDSQKIAYTYGPDDDGTSYAFEVVRGDRLKVLAMVRRELNVAPRYPYPTIPYTLDRLVNRDAFLPDPYFARRTVAEATVAVMRTPRLANPDNE